jgi:hypothetical protein
MALAYLALRGALLFQPGYQDDLKAYRRWAVAAAQQGVSRVYHASDMDYPPLYAYLLWPLGKVSVALAPKGGNPVLWTALVKLPPLAFDLVTAALLFRVGRRAEGDDATPPWRLLLPAAYLANPAVVFDTGYWGHPDSILGFFVLAALLLSAEGRAAAAFASLALATLMKPLAAPFFPLLALVVLLRSGSSGLLRGAAAAAATALAAFLPFVLAGEAGAVLQRVVLDLDAMPYTSVNAHNVWGLFGGWTRADAPVLGPVTATQLGTLVFGALLSALLLLCFRRFGTRGPQAQEAALLGAGVAFCFFMVSTHMHENHLFVALPLLAAALPLGRQWRQLFIAVTLAVLLNLALHDPELPGRWPFTLGGATEVARLSHGRVFFAAELMAVRAANLFNLCVFLWFLACVFRARPRTVPGLR